jgi:LuxR family transcriptional regulator, transcriptional regulator of spore coat protein
MTRHVNPHEIAVHFEHSPTGWDADFIRPILRMIASQMQYHSCSLHWLCAPTTKLETALIVSNFRSRFTEKASLGEVCPAHALTQLAAGHQAVLWRRPNNDEVATEVTNDKFGISIAFHDGYGTHIALTCSDKVQPAQIDTELYTNLALPFLASLAERHRTQVSLASKISPRELDCLQWSAAGKTSFETAIILGLSEATVNQHVANAITKLGAVNRPHAVAIAIKNGLLNLAAL